MISKKKGKMNVKWCYIYFGPRVAEGGCSRRAFLQGDVAEEPSPRVDCHGGCSRRAFLQG